MDVITQHINIHTQGGQNCAWSLVITDCQNDLCISFSFIVQLLFNATIITIGYYGE